MGGGLLHLALNIGFLGSLATMVVVVIITVWLNVMFPKVVVVEVMAGKQTTVNYDEK